jgi:hypothetical protein
MLVHCHDRSTKARATGLHRGDFLAVRRCAPDVSLHAMQETIDVLRFFDGRSASWAFVGTLLRESRSMTATTHLTMDEPRRRIGVVATQIVPGLQRLLDPLECIFPVSFEKVRLADLNGLDAALVLDPVCLPDTPADIPRLVLPPCGQTRVEDTVVSFAQDIRIRRPLRGRAIREDAAAAKLPLLPSRPELVFAAIGRKPVWWQASEAQEDLCVSAYPLPQLTEGDALRDYLRPGCFMGLLPLLHFLDHVVSGQNWEPPPLRASFVIDDPNLHWPSYGYLDYPEMVAHADRHGYHAGLAMVPLDGWLANHRAASLLKRNPSALSLLMHGNDHRSGELGHLADDRAAEAVVAQALRRTIAFERRSGVPVQRVMVPPHEVCSKSALRAMFRLGLDGACIGRRYPWRGRLTSFADASSLAKWRPADAWPLAKWHPTDMVAGGLPIIPRYRIDQPWEDLVFRALLHQPLILFGHHGDFAQGLEVLAEAADYVNGLGEVQWGSVGWIARQSFLTKRSGEALVVQMHSRRVTVEIPEDVTVLEVGTPSLSDGEPARHLAYGADRASMVRDGYGWTSGSLQVVPGTRLNLTLAPDRSLDPALVDARRVTPWPLVRRALAEGRDRIQPLSRRVPVR